MKSSVAKAVSNFLPVGFVTSSESFGLLRIKSFRSKSLNFQNSLRIVLESMCRISVEGGQIVTWKLPPGFSALRWSKALSSIQIIESISSSKEAVAG